MFECTESYCYYYYVCKLNKMSYLPLGWNETEGAALADRTLWTPSLVSVLLFGSNKDETDFTAGGPMYWFPWALAGFLLSVLWLLSNLHCCLHFVHIVYPKKEIKMYHFLRETQFCLSSLHFLHRTRATKHVKVSWFPEGWNAAKVLTLLGEENRKKVSMCYAWEHRSNFQRLF